MAQRWEQNNKWKHIFSIEFSFLGFASSLHYQPPVHCAMNCYLWKLKALNRFLIQDQRKRTEQQNDFNFWNKNRRRKKQETKLLNTVFIRNWNYRITVDLLFLFSNHSISMTTDSDNVSYRITISSVSNKVRIIFLLLLINYFEMENSFFFFEFGKMRRRRKNSTQEAKRSNEKKTVEKQKELHRTKWRYCVLVKENFSNYPFFFH